jgi:hypothetical protein
MSLTSIVFLGCLVVTTNFISTQNKDTVMTDRASGTFEVRLTPEDKHEESQNPTLGRISIDKQYHGDLEAVGTGQMLASNTSTKGSAGYVAMERVSGSLNGRKGTFVLQHYGVMARGASQLTITVVPDSGTDELVGLSGKMKINIVDGKHLYEFEYTLAASH